MEKRLKKQRNRLFLKVTLILLAVWLTVSATYCAIRLYSEKNDIQRQSLSDFAYIKQIVASGIGYNSIIDAIYLDHKLFEPDKQELDDFFDSQIIVTDQKTDTVIVDTAKKIGAEFVLKLTEESYSPVYGLIDYDTIRNALTAGEFENIKGYLTSDPVDGRHYELVCTKFYLHYVDIVPVELKIVLTEGGNSWFISDEIIETYSLDKNIDKDKDIFECGNMKRNTIPVDFMLNGSYNRDYISRLSKDEQKQAVVTVPTGMFEYIFYSSDFLFYGGGDSNFIQFAKQFNLLKSCGRELVIGIAIIFVFFLTIAVILCLMIWTMVKSQILQEQKRADMTGALAHDIKTPLFVISGYAYSLKEDIDSSERDEYLDNIIEQTERINSLVHNMLNLSKLDSYSITLNRSDFDLSELTAETLRDYTSLPGGRKITLTHSGSNEINADKELINTVVRNLTDNAVKYSMPDSEIKIDVTDRTLRVSNPSEELSRSELKQIWQPYVRKDKSRSKKGNGLGLSIVKSILDLHGAKYDAQMKGGEFVCTIIFREKE